MSTDHLAPEDRPARLEVGPQHRIPSLDGLRAISILLVLLEHFVLSLNLPVSPKVLGFFVVGRLGVKVFFAISGFLITGLLLKELAGSGRINLPRFYFQRTFRIFPAYYGFLAALFAMQVLGLVRIPPRDLLHAVTYTTNYAPRCSWNVGHTWSLSVEEQFYLLWPAAMLLLGRRGGLRLAGLLLVLCPLARLAYLVVPALAGINAQYHFETVADSLAVGCLLAGTFPWLERQAGYVRWLRSPWFVVVPLAALLLELLATRPSLLPPLIYEPVGVTIQNLLIAAWIHRSILTATSPTGRLLNARPVAFFGMMSYSIYLWQQPFLNPDPSSRLSRAPFNLALIAAAALTSYFLVEQPFLRLRQVLGRRLFGKPAAPREAPGSRVGAESAVE